MRVRLTPGHRSAGGTRIFEVVSHDYQLATGELTLVCRDGKLCVQLTGDWQIATLPSNVLPNSCDEAERIHDERTVIQLVGIH